MAPIECAERRGYPVPVTYQIDSVSPRESLRGKFGGVLSQALVGPCALPKLIPLYASPRDQQKTLPVMVRTPAPLLRLSPIPIPSAFGLTADKVGF